MQTAELFATVHLMPKMHSESSEELASDGSLEKPPNSAA